MPQNLKTKPLPAVDADALPELSLQQQKFVEGVVSGMSASDAYRAAYDCRDWLPSSVWCAASKLRSDAKVAQWVAAAQMAGTSNVTVTYERHIRELERLKQLSIASGNMGAAVQCEQTIGKAAGLHVERIQEIPHDPVQALKDIATTQPEIAASLAQQAGIAVEDIIPSARTLN